jgi:WD40 repeat protein
MQAAAPVPEAVAEAVVGAVAETTAENPYVGPVPFTTGQTLYGREADVQALVDLLVAKRVVLMISPSGAGKTSLIQAAMIPQVQKRFNVLPVVRLDASFQEGLANVNPYVYATIQVLEKRLEPNLRKAPGELQAMSLADYFRALPPLLDARGRVRFPLVIFDQFEELFTLNRSDWLLKKEFIRQVGELLGGSEDAQNEAFAEQHDDNQGEPVADAPTPPKLAPVPPVWALFSMREDHVAELEPYLHRIPTGLAFRYRLLPLEVDQAMQAISGPAPQDFPQDAAKALVDDLRRVNQSGSASHPDATFMGRFVEPLLLQVGCRRLWDQIVAGQGRPVAVADIGSTQDASQIDAALADYVSEEISAAAKLAKGTSRFLRDFLEDRLLSRNGVRTKVLRDPAQLGELAPAINRLIERHILRADVSGDREWIELSHDRLISPLYQGNQRWREQHLSLMQKQAKLWEEAGRPEDMLFTDAQLEQGETFAKEHPEFIGELDLKFLAESRQRRAQLQVEQARTAVIAQKNTQLKMQLGILLASSVVLVGVAAWLNVAIGEAKEARVVAEAAEKKSYRDLLGSRLKEAALLARDDNDTAGLRMVIDTQKEINERKVEGLDVAVDVALIRVLGRYPPIERHLGEHKAVVRSVAFAQGGALALSGSMDRKLGFWASAGNRTLGQSPGGHAAGVSAVAYHEGTGAGLAVSADEGGDIVLWELREDSLRKVSDIRWRLPAAGAGSVATDTKDPVVPQITSIAVNPQGTILAAASRQKQITMWDISNRARPRELASFGGKVHQSVIYRLSFVPDGPARGKLVSADWGGRVAVWSQAMAAETGDPDASYKTHEPVALHALAISPNGLWAFAGDTKGDLHVWPVLSRGFEQLGTKVVNKQSRGRINDLAFSNDGNSLFSVEEDKSLIRWSVPPDPSNAAGLEAVGASLARIQGWDEKLYAVAAHPKREGVLLIGGTKGVMLVDTEQRSPLARPIVLSGERAQSWRALRGSAKLDTLLVLETGKRAVRLLKESAGQYVAAGGMALAGEDVRSMALSRDGTEFALQGCSGRVMAASATRPAITPWLPVGAAPVQAGEAGPGIGAGRACAIRHTLWFTPDGKGLVAAHGNSVLVWRKADNGDWQGPAKTDVGREVLTMALDSKGEQVAMGTGANDIEVRALSNGQVAGSAVASSRGKFDNPVLALAFSADDKLVVASTQDPGVSTWEFQIEATRNPFNEQQERSVEQIATRWRGGTHAQFSADRTGQIEACFGALIGSTCTRLGRSFGTSITGLAVNDEGTRLVISGPGLFRWDLGRTEMLETAKRLANKGQ